MIVVDTSAWIEWLLSTRTSTTIEQHLPRPDTWRVPTIVQLELSKTLTRDVRESLAKTVIAFTKEPLAKLAERFGATQDCLS